MEVELLSPGVEGRRNTQIAAQTIATELQQSLGGAVEEQRVKTGGIEQDQRMEWLGQSEDAVIVSDRQQTGQLLFQPTMALGRQAAGTMAVAAGARGEMPLMASATQVDIGAQFRQAAGGQQAEHTQRASPQLCSVPRFSRELSLDGFVWNRGVVPSFEVRTSSNWAVEVLPNGVVGMFSH